MDGRNNTTMPVPPMEMVEAFLDNQALSDKMFYLLIGLYATIISFSVCGNLLVIYCVMTSKILRKAKNVLIVNLALSDLLLCTIVSPLTLSDILHKRWPGPQLQIFCQLSGFVPVFVTFVSTLSITGIAIERYKVIVYPTTSTVPKFPSWSVCVFKLSLIWSLSLLFSLPLVFTMELHIMSLPQVVLPFVEEDKAMIAYCVEDWGDYDRGRFVYSIFIFAVQFVLPLVLLCFAHYAIKRKLQEMPSWRSHGRGSRTGGQRTVQGGENCCVLHRATTTESDGDPTRADHNNHQHGDFVAKKISVSLKRLSLVPQQIRRLEAACEECERRQEKLRKQARTHSLLVSIVIIFALSWFPLNVLNIVRDFREVFTDDETERLCFALCHLIGMSSAFSNPILYGGFNDSFKNEFVKTLSACKKLFFKSSSPN